jgi:hypothetical protein
MGSQLNQKERRKAILRPGNVACGRIVRIKKHD